MTASARPRARRTQRGVSTVELMVALGLMAVVSTMVVDIAVGAQAGLATMADRAAATTEARLLLDRAGELVRGARPRGWCPTSPSPLTTAVRDCRAPAEMPPTPGGVSGPLITAGASELRFYSYAPDGAIASDAHQALNPPETMRLWVDAAGALRLDTYQPTAAADYTNPAWAATPVSDEVVGELGPGPGPFAYRDDTGAPLFAPFDPAAVASVDVTAVIALARSRGSISASLHATIRASRYRREQTWNAT